VITEKASLRGTKQDALLYPGMQSKCTLWLKMKSLQFEGSVTK